MSTCVTTLKPTDAMKGRASSFGKADSAVPEEVVVDLSPGPMGVTFRIGRNGAGGVIVKRFTPVNGSPGPLEAGGVKPGMKLVRVGERDVSAMSYTNTIMLLLARASKPRQLAFTQLNTIASERIGEAHDAAKGHVSTFATQQKPGGVVRLKQGISRTFETQPAFASADSPTRQSVFHTLASTLRIGLLVDKVKRKFTDKKYTAPVARGNPMAERQAVQRYREQNAIVLLQKIFRGYSGRTKATLALEFAMYNRPEYMAPGMLWYRRVIKTIVYMLVVFLILFAWYLNLIFGIKFDKEQQTAWFEGFVASLFMDLVIGIPIQIILMKSMPHEFIKVMSVIAGAIVLVYVLNGI